MEQTINNTVFGVSTYSGTHSGWETYWRDFPFAFNWIWDESDGVKGKGFTYSEGEMCDNLGFFGSVSKKHYWNSYGNKNIVWFYANFRMLWFYKNNPQYKWYWFFDDDVTCNNWELFINSFSNVKKDFISWFLFSKEDYGNDIPTIDEETTSKHMWFKRFPGDGDKLPLWISQWYGSFFPVVRFSNTALNTLLNQFSLDFSGYSEGFVPTILNGYNYSLGSIFNKDGTSQYYDTSKIDLKHKLQNIGWEWI